MIEPTVIFSLGSMTSRLACPREQHPWSHSFTSYQMKGSFPRRTPNIVALKYVRYFTTTTTLTVVRTMFLQMSHVCRFKWKQQLVIVLDSSIDGGGLSNHSRSKILVCFLFQRRFSSAGQFLLVNYLQLSLLKKTELLLLLKFVC